MIVDTSALVAIAAREEDADIFERAVAEGECAISSVSYLEASIVLTARYGPQALAQFDLWLETSEIDMVDFTAEHARLARAAYAAFGKGRHRAGLNFGDCAAYALAAATDRSLLYKGEDFSKTDIPSANRP